MKGKIMMVAREKKVGKFSVKIITKDDNLVRDKIISQNDAEMDNRATEAVRSALNKAKFCKKPIAKYDVIAKRAYVELADGERKYVN